MALYEILFIHNNTPPSEYVNSWIGDLCKSLGVSLTREFAEDLKSRILIKKNGEILREMMGETYSRLEGQIRYAMMLN